MRASCQLVEMTGAEIAGITVLIELDFLHGRDLLCGYSEVHSVLRYGSED